MVYYNFLINWKKTSDQLIFQHFLIGKRSKCDIKLLDSDPFYYFKESYNNQNLINLIPLDKGLSDLQPLIDLPERNHMRLYRKILLFISLAYLIFIIVMTSIIFSNPDSKFINIYIYVSIFMFIIIMIWSILNIFKIFQINTKINYHLQKINIEIYEKIGLKWSLNKNCGCYNNLMVLEKIQNTV